jgi:hypothetical protein
VQENNTWTEITEAILQRIWGELQSVSSTILDDGLSNFPIFILCKTPLALGENITEQLSEDDLDGYQVMASTAEELIKAHIIEAEKAKVFVASYKNPRQFACVLMVSETGSGFVYFPYK